MQRTRERPGVIRHAGDAPDVSVEPRRSIGGREHVARVRDVVPQRVDVRAQLAERRENRCGSDDRRPETRRCLERRPACEAHRTPDQRERERKAQQHEPEVRLEQNPDAHEDAAEEGATVQPQPACEREETERREHRVAGVVVRARQQQRVRHQAERSHDGPRSECPQQERRAGAGEGQPEDVEEERRPPVARREGGGVGVVEERVLVVPDVDVEPVAVEQPRADAEEDPGVGVGARPSADGDQRDREDERRGKRPEPPESAHSGLPCQSGSTGWRRLLQSAPWPPGTRRTKRSGGPRRSCRGRCSRSSSRSTTAATRSSRTSARSERAAAGRSRPRTSRSSSSPTARSTAPPSACSRRASDVDMRVIHYDRNLGKGYAVKLGALAARGDWIALVDADLDLDPGGDPGVPRDRAARGARPRDRLEAPSRLGRRLPALAARDELGLPAAEPRSLRPRRPRHPGRPEGVQPRRRRRRRARCCS